MFQLNKKHQKYEKYNPTNIDWIGDIPNGWEVWKLKRLGNIETWTTPPKAEEGNYMEDGIPWIKPDNLDGFVPLNDSKEKLSQMGALQARIIKKGSVLVCGIGTIGKIGVAGCDLTTNQQINSITFNQKIDELFGQYLVFASRKEMEKQSNKVVVSILNKSQQSNIFYPVCSLQEQQKIATYLNEKTAILDEAIVKKKNQIELLAEHRTALINDAITKGLDTNVEMKDSGIEWIGMIPKGWITAWMTKYITSIVDYRWKTPNKTDDGIPLITARNIKGWKIDFELSKEYINPLEYSEIMSRWIPEKWDLLFTMEAPLWEVAVIEDNNIIALAQRIIKLRPNHKLLNSRFLLYWITSSIFQADLQSLATGSTALWIKASKLHKLRLILPILDEQKNIVEYLDKELNYINDMIAKIEKSIELLEEYKTSLISHAVSGKIKVS